MNETVIIIEDEPDLLELLEFHIQKAGFDAVGFSDTKNVREFLEEENCSLMIVDRNLGRVEGSEFVSILRKEGINVPVIFATAKESEKEVEEGFLRGGDDYIKKPFNMNELILRVKAIIARTEQKHQTQSFRDILLDIDARKAFIGGVDAGLTKLEFNLLEIFIKNRNRALDRDYLLEQVWRDEADYNRNTVTVSIGRLLKKIDPNKEKGYIKPVRQIGYILCDD
ncbi:DNA-binding response regulator [Campylobacterota bacterium]|nr:DNA-binding response regulator [Campylobacterota bacterium]